MKTELILLLYDALLRGEAVPRMKFCGEHKISERTFYRYLRVVSEFLRSYKPAYFIDIAEQNSVYYMKKN